MEMSFDSSGSPSCSCKSGYSQAGVSGVGELYCVLTSIGSTFVSSAASAAETDIFIDAATSATSVDSLVVQHYFPGAATSCKHYRDGTSEAQFACQTLANLCVLNHYSSSQACNVLDDVYTDRGTNVINNVETWYAGVPWLSYKSDEVDVVCMDNQLDDLMTFNEKEMKFWVSKFSINGTWHGYEELGTTLSYCTQEAPDSGSGGGTSTSTKWQIFGASGTNAWNCDLDTLRDQDQYFYDLYYEDRSGDLYPVPVRFTQYSDGGAFPNQVSEDLSEDRAPIFLYCPHCPSSLHMTKTHTLTTFCAHPRSSTHQYYRSSPKSCVTLPTSFSGAFSSLIALLASQA
jgi:hypothetical protein